MWPLALTHGGCYDIIKSSAGSGVERFRVDEDKKWDEAKETVVEISVSLIREMGR